MLSSQLLSTDTRLQSCETQDSSHVKPGDHGNFVNLIQRALSAIDNVTIADPETSAGRYGPSTASAVLAYKTKRQIVNRAYQSKPDDIVGKMTIRRLDDDMLALEAQGGTDVFVATLRNARGRMV